MCNPQISVITIVFNGRGVIEDTIESVLQQNKKNIEYIIIDGGSTDGTKEIIEKYHQQIDHYITEPDHGIYDAMNKGIRLSTGRWLIFMNAGDVFADVETLKNIDLFQSEDSALVYGNSMSKGESVKPKSLDYLKQGVIMASHQSMFFNRAVLKKELIYDCNYPIYADYELVNKIYTSGYILNYQDVNISIREAGGISSVVSKQKRKDKYRIVFKYYGIRGVIGSFIHRIWGES